jgi:3-hydroxyisobutyrate dehydrogenase-like beta-hydroxyacid dehydrogenase
MIAERRYAPPGFDIRLGRKDLRLAQEAAQASGVELGSLPTLVDAFEAALGGGLDGLDWAAMAETTRTRSGAAPLPPQQQQD